MQLDHSAWIDSCDLVLRFNEGKTVGNNSGTKTDILCISNIGGPAFRIIKNTSIYNAPFFAQLSEIWFPRDINYHLNYLHQNKYLHRNKLWYRESELVDQSQKLIESNQLTSFRIVYFSQDLNRQAFEMLQTKDRKFICPSTGFLAISYIMNEPRFDEYDKLLFGFTFKAWEGHPMKAEKQIVLKDAGLRNCLHYVPSKAQDLLAWRYRYWNAEFMRSLFPPSKWR